MVSLGLIIVALNVNCQKVDSIGLKNISLQQCFSFYLGILIEQSFFVISLDFWQPKRATFLIYGLTRSAGV